jgi:hypothetical protein
VLDSELVAQTSTYSADDLCGSPATDVGFVDPGYFHSALLTSLVPGETVYYRVVSEGGQEEDVGPHRSPSNPVYTCRTDHTHQSLTHRRYIHLFQGLGRVRLD